MTRRLLGWLLILGSFWAGMRPAHAYSLGSSLTTSCHEVVTFAGLLELARAADTSALELPRDPIWRKAAYSLARAVRASNPSAPAADSLDDRQRFLMWSVVVGVRAPDIEGHSVTDMATLRALQADRSAEGQYVHALRGLDDDGIRGDLAAVAGMKRVLRDVFAQARDAKAEPQNIRVPFYLDFYGAIDVEVARIPYLLGRAAHTLQDAHAHTVRSDDGAIVYSVSNYLEAIRGDLLERRDGLAHSDSLDDCTGPIGTLTERASSATLGMALAARAYLDGDDALLEQGLSPCDPAQTDYKTCGWITYNPECAAALAAGDSAAERATCCTLSNDYCGSKWLATFREQQSGPYLKEILGCNFAPGERAAASSALAAAALLAVLCLRRRRRAATWSTLARSTLALATLTPSARAALADAPTHPAAPVTLADTDPREQPIFIGLEGHLSLFSDAAETSLLNTTLGYAVRGGYRWTHWGVLGQIERNSWLPTELSSSLAAGTLNLGVGVEYMFAAGFIHSSLTLGPSILLFDTALHDKGRTGFFFDLRPLGVRYPALEHLLLNFDPLTLAVVQPIVFDENVIRQIEYRTLFGLEAAF